MARSMTSTILPKSAKLAEWQIFNFLSPFAILQSQRFLQNFPGAELENKFNGKRSYFTLRQCSFRTGPLKYQIGCIQLQQGQISISQDILKLNDQNLSNT